MKVSGCLEDDAKKKFSYCVNEDMLKWGVNPDMSTDRVEW